MDLKETNYFYNFNNMFNTSDNVTMLNPEATSFRLVINNVYFIFGLFGLIFNGLVLVFLFPAKQIHPLLMTGLALADFLNAIGYLTYGLRGLILSQTSPFLLSPLQCMTQGVHINFFEIGESASSMTTMFVSMDRLLAMIYLTTYRNFNVKYAYCLLCLSAVYTLGDLLASWIGSANMDQTPNKLARCGHPQNVPELYYKWHTWHIIVCGYVSIAFYIVAFCAMKFRNISSNLHSSNQLKREAKVTKRIASIVLITFVLQVLTLTIYTTDIGNAYLFDVIGPYLWSLYALIPSVNVIIYSSTSSEFRRFVRKLVGGKNQVTPMSAHSATKEKSTKYQNTKI